MASSLICDNNSGTNKLALALKLQLAARRIGKFRVNMSIGVFVNKDFSRSGRTLQTGRDIYGISQHCIIRDCAFADIANKGLACRNPGAGMKLLAVREAVHSLENPQRCLHRSLRVILRMERGTEKCHHLIADKLIEGTVVVKDAARR